MAIKERGQNPVVGDQLNLRLFSWNSNNKTNVYSFQAINIYFYDPNERTLNNPEGKRLVQTFTASDVQQTDVGEYYIQAILQYGQYVIGHYSDVWIVQVEKDDPVPITWENHFQIYPNLWFMATEPLAYDFSFYFRPNRLRLGAIQYLVVNIKPNVPHASDLHRYYMDLAINSPLSIYMIQTCGECLPEDEDERTVINGDPIIYRDKCEGRYLLNTTELYEGIYDVWFEMSFGDSVFVSDRQQLQLYA